MKKLILIIAVLSYSVIAQPIITSGDIANQFAIGNSSTVHAQDSPTTINIGSLGGGNTWDFTSLQTGTSTLFTSVNPTTTPHINEFSGADIALHSIGVYSGEQAEMWAYSNLGASFDFMGSAIVLASHPSDLLTIKDNPPSQVAVFPFTWNSHWTQTYTEIVAFNSAPILSTTYSIDVTVDAYGTMTLPGGVSFAALRSRYVKTDGVNTMVSYNFVSKEGASVSLSASDSNPPVTGVINIAEYNWNTEFSSEVEQINNLQEDYSLSQNYPNPFNPNTTINFSIPEELFVSLKIFNTLGEAVKTLVAEELNAGNYKYDWEAINLPSGIYFYQLKAGSYVDTKKMLLIK
jgi:hypothetical protein